MGERKSSGVLATTKIVVTVTLGLATLAWLVVSLSSDWKTSQVVLPAFGASLLTFGALVQVVVALWDPVGKREQPRDSERLKALGWAAVLEGAALSAVVPVTAALQYASGT
jgi:hypothetical protein